MLDYFIENSLVNHLMELMAALGGTFFLVKRPSYGRGTKLLVVYLWLNLIFDLSGFYTTYAYFTDFEGVFSYIKGTPFQRNFWWFNIFMILQFLLLFAYFAINLKAFKTWRPFGLLALLFTTAAIVNLVFSGVFFTAFSTFTMITGTLILMLLIGFYFLELLKSEVVLQFQSNLVFYVAVTVLVWNLVISPLFIYNSFFRSHSPEFVAFHAGVMKMATIFMYSGFTLGFLICSREKRSYS